MRRKVLFHKRALLLSLEEEGITLQAHIRVVAH
jgi:hypothetical protein